MNAKKCKKENEVLNSLRKKDLSPDIKEHIKECGYCKDLQEVATWMEEFGDLVSLSEKKRNKNLPEAEDIWAGALEPERVSREIVEKVMLPLRLVQIFTNLVISAGIIIFILWKFGDISRSFKNYFRPDYFDVHFFSYILRLFTSSYFISIPIVLILILIFSYLLYSFIKPFKREYAEDGY